MTSRHGNARSGLLFIHASAQSVGGRDPYHVTRQSLPMLERLLFTVRMRSGRKAMHEWQVWPGADWLFPGPGVQGAESATCPRAACDVTHRASWRHSYGRRRAEGGVRKRGMSDCPFVDPRVNNSNLVKISHLPGLRKIKGFMCVIKLLYLFP